MLKMLLAAGAALVASAAVAPVPAQNILPGEVAADAGLVVRIEHGVEVVEPFAFAEPVRVYASRALPPDVILDSEVRVEVALSSRDVRRILTRRGFRAVDSVRRSRGAYRVRATDPHGNRVWLTLSARSGAILGAQLAAREAPKRVVRQAPKPEQRVVRQKPAPEKRVARAEPKPEKRVVRQAPRPEQRVVRQKPAPEEHVVRTLQERVAREATVAAVAPQQPERLPEARPEVDEAVMEVAAVDAAAAPAIDSAAEPTPVVDVPADIDAQAPAADEAAAAPDDDEPVEEASTTPNEPASDEAAETTAVAEEDPTIEEAATPENVAEAPAEDESLSDKTLAEEAPAQVALAPAGDEAAAESARKPIRDVTRQPKPVVEEPADVAALGGSATEDLAGEAPAADAALAEEEPAANDAEIPLAAQQAAVLAPVPLPRERPAGGEAQAASAAGDPPAGCEDPSVVCAD